METADTRTALVCPKTHASGDLGSILKNFLDGLRYEISKSFINTQARQCCL
jgi:hypothetical protein